MASPFVKLKRQTWLQKKRLELSSGLKDLAREMAEENVLEPEGHANSLQAEAQPHQTVPSSNQTPHEPSENDESVAREEKP